MGIGLKHQLVWRAISFQTSVLQFNLFKATNAQPNLRPATGKKRLSDEQQAFEFYVTYTGLNASKAASLQERLKTEDPEKQPVV